MSADGPGNREVAHRVFAAEFDDASLSYSESDEERAPNYVVTPTGARVNRLFAVGVLTEVESVNEDTVRGRVVDPTGAFVTYAGQYQPDEHAFLSRTTPPAFVAMTGKARTFEPDDSDAVYTSVRPESFNEVDAATRDRWSVSAAENTLDRLAVFAAALESALTGDRLRAALEAAGVGGSLAAGVPRAIDHYGTTTAYLEAVRRLSVQTLEQVAGDREDVDPLAAAPDEAGPAELGSLPAPDLDLSVPEGFEESEDASAGAPDVESASADSADTEAPAESAEADTDHVATGEPAASNEVDVTADGDAETPDPGTPESEAGGDEVDEDAIETEERTEADAETTQESEAPEASAEEAADAPASAGEPGAGDLDDEPATEGVDDLGDFDEERSTESSADEDAEDDLGDFDAGDDELGDEDALTEAERAEVEAEYGTDFSTGSEVGGPGEADIDVPSSEEDLETLDEDTDADADADSATATEADADDDSTDVEDVDREDVADADPAAGTPGSDPEPEEEAGDVGDEDDVRSDDEAATANDEPADVDLEAAAVEQMRELDDGDGASHDEVVAAVVDATGADPGDVEDAVQDALLSGQCYEPADGTLKAI